MTTSTITDYAVYLTAATSTQPAGTVVNRVVWDGVAVWSPPAGQAAVADAANDYPIGSTYAASSSSA